MTNPSQNDKDLSRLSLFGITLRFAIVESEMDWAGHRDTLSPTPGWPISSRNTQD